MTFEKKKQRLDIALNISLKYKIQRLTGTPVFKTLCSQSRGTGSIPSRGTKISHAEPAQPKKKKQLNLYYGVLNNI